MSPVNKKIIERTACYIRVSTQEQKLHGYSLDAQRDKLKRYAKENNLKIVEWYEDEGVSGRKLIRRRPALQRMLKDAELNKFDRIIFIKLDRYFRSVAEYHECQKILQANNVVWTATEEKYDLTTASGRFWINQKLSMAEYEADNGGERIKLVNEYKVKEGQALTGAQRQGLAFTVKKDENGIKRVVKDPETQEIVMDYINHLLTYHSKRGAMLYANEKHNKTYDYRVYDKLLKDTKMYGFYRGNPNYCEPYYDKATFDKLQKIGKSTVKKAKSNRIYYFTGLVKCPDCGLTLTSAYNQTKYKRKKDGSYYIYDHHMYRCGRHTLNHNVCKFKKKVNESLIEKAIMSTLEDKIHSYIDWAKIEDARVKDSHAQDRVEKIKKEINKLNKIFRYSETMSDQEYERDIKELNKQLKEAESHLEPIIERDLTKYEKLLSSDWKTLYAALNRENKRAFWRKYIKEIHVTMTGEVTDIIFF